ncbi:hypothetical protein NE236_36785 [Actinoallomurus purpureus]|uniref:hypothetical protein n=1 Tax=Actinoallomurus purpureus TaxID=478114 RepID=UPI002092B3A4|nr:hypothetical protein [Actinoallomurus purpureus]MCO6010529.1 hypothetical protein [Actinoallomurus purpureus]
MSVPELDELAGPWLSRDDLAHLHSLRNQWGQAHVNDDLTSLSWLTFPPYSVGYHTGALRIDAVPLAAERLRWSPWGVEREGATGRLHVRTDVRMGYERSDVLWRLTLSNPTDVTASVTVEQDLLACAARSEVDWGWLYGTPWTAGHHHDYFATERIRAEVTAVNPRQPHLVPPDARSIRLGRPRIPGIQRDEDQEPMLLETTLPDHTAPDAVRERPPGVRCRVRRVVLHHPDGSLEPVTDRETEIEADTDVRLAAVTIGDGAELRFEVMFDHAGQSGVILTHGNHPDSLQIGLRDGHLTMGLAGERVTAAERLPSGVWHRIAARIGLDGAELRAGDVPVAATAPWWGDARWQARITDDAQVIIADSRTTAVSAYAFSHAPDELGLDGCRGTARWELSLPPGGRTTLGVVLAITDDSGEARHTAATLAADFDAAFEGIARRWRRTWRSAFDPQGDEFSGHLPTLHTENADLGRTYYLAALLAIYMRNTKVSPLGPVFLTGGPRLGPTTTFFWDQSEWPRTAAMLEPAGTRAWILAALAQPYEECHSFDTRNLLPIGNHYTANDHALFRVVEAYIGVTGDLALLDEPARGGTVLDHLRHMAYRPRHRRARFGDGILADFGNDAWELLECVPNYRHAVVSFNAGYVGMLRSLGAVLRLRGAIDEAERAEADAAELARAVLAAYAGNGRWSIGFPDHREAIGHCLDFQLVAAEMPDVLPESVRREMAEFVIGSLLDGDWMRALDPDDPIAPYADRPDHGAAGAFAAWPADVAYGLCRLGRPEVAAEVLARAHRTTSGALWGQAMEVTRSPHYRVAEHGVSNRDSSAAVAFAETVLAGLFGIGAGFAGLLHPQGSAASVAGELTNVRAVGFDLAPAGAEPPKE